MATSNGAGRAAAEPGTGPGRLPPTPRHGPSARRGTGNRAPEKVCPAGVPEHASGGAPPAPRVRPGAAGGYGPSARKIPDDRLERVCLRNLLALTDEAIYFKDRDNRFILVSRGVVEHHADRLRRAGQDEEATTLGLELFIGKTDVDLFDAPLALEWMAEERRIIETGQGIADVLERDVVDGSGGWFRTSKGALRDDDGEIIGTFGITRDVTAQVSAEQEVLRREAELRAVLDSSPDAIAFYDSELRYYWVNAKAAAMVGLGQEQLIGRTDGELGRPAEVVALLASGLERALRTKQMCEVEYSVGDGGEVGEVTEKKWFQVRMVPRVDVEGGVVGVVAATRDLTELKEAQAVLAYQALHDPLTGAANRLALVDRLEGALAALERDPGRVALLFIDLDNFKHVNDARGHDVGDELLVQVAGRLALVTRGTDTVARLGGDEFVVLFERLGEVDDAYFLADRALSALSAPFELGGTQLRLSASMGLVVTSSPRSDPGELLRNADIAMYQAKQKGRGRIELFHPMYCDQTKAAERLGAELELAVKEDQFFLLYQPLYSLGDHSLVGVEALVRWRHPTLGVLGPEEFIPLAEQLDLSGQLGYWVLHKACRQLALWKATISLCPGFHMAVNMSARQLASPGFVAQVSAALDANGLGPGELCLEITETAKLEGWGGCGETLGALVASGARVALDDPGVGYSSLAYLHAFRVNTLKIDRNFVARLGAGSNMAIVAGVVAMAHALGMSVVAEGVETEPELRRAMEVDFDEVQGFLFARPLTAEVVAGLLARYGAALSA